MPRTHFITLMKTVTNFSSLNRAAGDAPEGPASRPQRSEDGRMGAYGAAGPAAMFEVMK